MLAKRGFWLLGIFAAVVLVALLGRMVMCPLLPKKTVEERVAQYGAAVRARLAPDFARAGVAYPPKAVVLAGLKEEAVMEVWVSGDGAAFALVKTYPIRRASGTWGPKLREGDRQVPEGVYGVASLNPNSRFHLALRIDYPNAFDVEKARADGRTHLGGDIMIHGGHSSIGCLAMGDDVSEELFVLAAETGIDRVTIILAPWDLRKRPAPEAGPDQPPWLGDLYGMTAQALRTKCGGG